MTLETPEALVIPARTDAGSGLALPLAKALAHLMLVHEASAREWPITNEIITAELREANTHLNTLVWPEELMTPELYLALQQWTAHLVDTTIEANNTPGDTEFDKDKLKSLVEATWNLLSHVDREVVGFAGEPGRRP